MSPAAKAEVIEMARSAAEGRVQIEDRGYELHITAHPSRGAGTGGRAVFLFFWLMGWACGEAAAGSAVLTMLGYRVPHSPHILHPHSSEAVFLWLWLAAWTFGGYVALLAFLWTLWGKEEMVVATDRLTLSTNLPRRTREYLVSGLSRIRLNFPLPGDRASAAGARPTLLFDYQGKTRQFGVGLEGVEAINILHHMEKYYHGLVELTGGELPGNIKQE
jgi:hypothetical protein